jgi:uncharacterized protein
MKNPKDPRTLPRRQAPSRRRRLAIDLACMAAAALVGVLSVLFWLTPSPPKPEEQGEITSLPRDEAPARQAAETGLSGLAPPASKGEPRWIRFAVPAPATQGLPRIAIVIDDLGIDRKRSERAIALKPPLTLSFIAYAHDLPQLAGEARRAGHELMLHVPMEPLSRAEDMGPNGLAIGLERDELLRRLRWNLERFEGYVGINNHMGSRFTGDAKSLAPVMEELKARGLLFLDSRTIATSAGAEVAQHYGVPNAARDVFLDNEINAVSIAQQLAEAEAVARHRGTAIAIGHPHDATLDALTSWLDELSRKGLVLVPVSAVVRERWHAAGEG